MRTLGGLALVRGPSGFGEFWACFHFSLSVVILVPSEEPSHGLWSLYLPGVVLWLLYIRALSLPFLVQKASRSWSLLMACHPSTVLSSVSFPMTSPHSSLYAGWGFALDAPAPSGVRISRCLFFLQTFATFFRVVMVIMFGNSRSVLRSLLDS